MNAKEQNKLAGIFLLIHGILQGLGIVFVILIYGAIGAGMFATAKREEDQMVGLFILGLFLMVGLISMAFILPQIIGGWKMLKEKPNARIWGIIGSILACMSFPLGTAAGVYGLIFLCGDEGKRFYDYPVGMKYLGGMNAANNFQYNYNQQHQPHRWQ